VRTPDAPLATEEGLRQVRHSLHRHPELSGEEEETARRIARWLSTTGARDLRTGIGGHGVAARIPGRGDGPAVALRAELDALPIPEAPASLPHASSRAGCAHKCGHDGHMTILLGLAAHLSTTPPAGDVFLLFQPAEETGQGAAAMLADPGIGNLPLAAVLALHNLPGHPLGTVLLRRGPFAAASVGITVDLAGRTAHAGECEMGRSPAAAMATLVHWFEALPQQVLPFHVPARVTVIHARLGEVAFGTTPGFATVMATLRADSQESLDHLQHHCRTQLPALASAYGLTATVTSCEPFPATINDPAVVQAFREAAQELALPTCELPAPFPWSEDFGHFTRRFPAAMVGFGAGLDRPPLHALDYDFPDDAILPGIRLLTSALSRLQAPDGPLATAEVPRA
jgi:amidohydrolase